MSDIYVPLNVFMKRFEQEGTSIILENKKRIVAVRENGIVVHAFKKSTDKLSKRAIAFNSIGYPGVSSTEDKNAQYPEDLIAEIRSDFYELPEEEQKKLIAEFTAPKEEDTDE